MYIYFTRCFPIYKVLKAKKKLKKDNNKKGGKKKKKHEGSVEFFTGSANNKCVLHQS